MPMARPIGRFGCVTSSTWRRRRTAIRSVALPMPGDSPCLTNRRARATRPLRRLGTWPTAIGYCRCWKRGGPGYRDVAIREVPPTHYYDPVDGGDDDIRRRTIYRFSPRGSRSGLLDTFDCPDPSARTQERSVTTTPGQVLSQWNDGFVLEMAEAFARRVEGDVGAGGTPADRDARLEIGRAHV